MPPAIFQRELPPGWVYPCTTEDIRRSLARLPEGDLEGIQAIGLVPCRQELNHVYATYWCRLRPVIEFPAWREPFVFRHMRAMSRNRLLELCAAEVRYGMSIEFAGGRWVSAWEREDLGRFLAEHVLAHEVGHHVNHLRHASAGRRGCPARAMDERMAEEYAVRMGGLRLRSVKGRCSCHRWPHADRPPHRQDPRGRLYPAQRANHL